MKKIICFILITVMLLGLCACGSTKNTSEPAVETANTAASEESTSTEAVSPNILSTEVTSGANDTASSTSSSTNSSTGSEPQTVTAKMESAAATAKNYLTGSCFSRDGLIEMLEYENYTEEEAAYGADHCGADWYEQAVETAKAYLECIDFSRQELLDQMVSIGFSEEEAEYGVNQVFE